MTVSLKSLLRNTTILGTAVMASGLWATGAIAQTAETTADQPTDQQSNEIVVTGSRINTSQYTQANPIEVVTAQKIEQSGQTNLTEILSQNPALLGSTKLIDTAGSNLANAQQTGSNFLNLRNLGTSRTLVLVDGRRHVAGSPGTAAVDINTIPTDLVERVDVLTGGVSAVYGADGVSGVVNFIMKKNVEGLNLRGQTSISQRGDAGERFAAATFGKNFSDGRGNITLAYEFNETDRFSQKSRLDYGMTGPSWRLVRNPADGTPGTASDNPAIPDRILMTGLRWADSSMGGAIDFTFDGVPEYTGEGNPYNVGTYVPGTPFTVGGDSTPAASYYGDFTPYTRRHIANLLTHYDFSPMFNLYAEAKYVKTFAWTESQPTYDLYTQLNGDNAYLLQRFGAALASGGALFSRDNFDFGQRRYQLDRDLIRGVLGAKGDLSEHLRYDLSFVFGQSTQRSTNFGDRITDRYYAALDAVDDGTGHITCRINLPGETTINGVSYGNPGGGYSGPPVTFQKGQCVPLNILGNGSPSQAALDFVLANHSDYARIRQYVATFALSGDTGAFFNLPGGPVGFAIGAEYRKESSHYVPSYYSQQAALIDNSAAQIEDGHFDVKEAFAEVNLPLLKDSALGKDLSFGGAIRLSDYSTAGQTTTWNLKGQYTPVELITFRGTYSRSVRAPNITELFSPLNGTFEFISDPCGIDRIGEGKPTRPANCTAALTALGINPATFDPANSPISPANSSLLGTQGGNPGLKPEVAKTWTAGTVVRPMRGLTLSADWYDIRLTQAIQYSSAQDIVDLCYDQASLNNNYCALITRSPTTGFVSGYTVIPQNVASFKTAGLDFTANYGTDLSPSLGKVNLRFAGNYLDKLQFVPSLGADPQNEMDSASYPAPRWSATFDLTWKKGPVTVNYGINWWDKTRRVTREQQKANPDYAPPQYIWYRERWEHNLYISADVADKFTLYGGVNNLFDRKPDDGATAYPISAVGRSFFIGAKAKLF
ncbi:MAG: TonB-dependent receptor [Sphingomonadales bacterium]|nr:TonB-dependent receptor [Sphingomonadales bacterium]